MRKAKKQLFIGTENFERVQQESSAAQQLSHKCLLYIYFLFNMFLQNVHFLSKPVVSKSENLTSLYEYKFKLQNLRVVILCLSISQYYEEDSINKTVLIGLLNHLITKF